MNKQYYSFGNPFKVKFREHYCYRCGSKLSIVKHHKVVSQKSDEAKYYDFSVGVDGGVIAVAPAGVTPHAELCGLLQSGNDLGRGEKLHVGHRQGNDAGRVLIAKHIPFCGLHTNTGRNRTVKLRAHREQLLL